MYTYFDDFFYLFFSVTVPGYQGNLQAAISQSSALAPWERFGVEFILTFIVVLSYLVSTNSYKKYLGTTSITIGAAYSACSFVSVSTLGILIFTNYFNSPSFVACKVLLIFRT
jgi:hypothetical protein